MNKCCAANTLISIAIAAAPPDRLASVWHHGSRIRIRSHSHTDSDASGCASGAHVPPRLGLHIPIAALALALLTRVTSVARRALQALHRRGFHFLFLQVHSQSRTLKVTARTSGTRVLSSAPIEQKLHTTHYTLHSTQYTRVRVLMLDSVSHSRLA